MNFKNKDIYMTRGDSETISISLSDTSDVSIPFEPGDTVYLTIKTDANTSTKVLQKQVTSFVGGKAIFTIQPSDTSSLNYGSYLYDIQWTRSDGFKRTIITPSMFVIEKEVTYE